jgi:hypothetical protein
LGGAGVLVTLTVAFILLRYACPSSDDLYRGGIIRVRPWYSEIAWNYSHWSGRWSGIGLSLVIQTWVDLFRWYPVLLMGLIVFQALGLRAFWRLLLGETAPRRIVLALIATTMAVIWAGLPSPGETWYWMTGGLENQLGIFLSILLISGLVRSRWEEMNGWRARARIAALSLLALFITGLHELIAATLLLVLAPGTAIAHKSRQSTPRRRAWQAVGLSAVIGSAIVVLAPGNSTRAADYAKLHSASELRLSHTLAMIWSHVSAEVPSWVLDVRLLSATLALVLSPFFARARAGGVHWGGISPRLVVTAVWLLSIITIFVGPISVFHGWIPLRTVSLAYTLFVLGWVTAVFVSTRPRAEPGDSTTTALEAIGPRFARSAALAILGLSLLVTGNTRDGIKALRKGVPQTLNRMVHWRDHLIRRAARRGAAELDLPLRNLGSTYLAKFPRLYPFSDISEDPSYMVNLHYATYYGLKVIRRVPPGARLSVKTGRRTEAVSLKSDGAPILKH